MIIGLTGGIACGKSTVADMLVRRGAMLIDADRIAREVVEPGTPALRQIAETFGESVLLPDGSLDRKKLGSLIFGDESKRLALNEIVHPAVRAEIKQRMERNEAIAPDKLSVVDIPLLYESKLYSMFEEVMVVYAPPAVQIERLMKRNDLSREEAEARLNAQMPIEEKRKLADIVIDNGGTIEETEAQVDVFWKGKNLK